MTTPNTQGEPYPSAAFDQPPAPAATRGRRRLVVAVVVLGVLVLGAATAAFVFTGRKSEPRSAAPVSASAVVPTTTSAGSIRPTGSVVEFEPGGARACAALGKLYGTDAMYDPDKLQPVGEQAVKSTDFDIRLLGQLLIDGAKLARAAKGQGDELTRKLEMSNTAVKLLTRCTKEGYPTT